MAKHSVVRYLFIGTASFLLDIGMLALLHEVLFWPLWLATAIAFLGSFVFNYSLQRTFSFGSRESHAGSLVRYLTLLVFNTLATIVIVAAVDGIAGWGVGKVVATGLSTVWTYFAYRYWVFTTGP